jgi:hypothetical protein
MDLHKISRVVWKKQKKMAFNFLKAFSVRKTQPLSLNSLWIIRLLNSFPHKKIFNFNETAFQFLVIKTSANLN